MTEEESRPKWLLELENRKRKQRLGHETGAGAACLSCESACPGLDLHFWRKICKNCKCRGDDHDFDDDEFPQFELLFGPNVKHKKKSRSVLLRVNDKKQAQTPETPFEWVPPDTTKELAADYMRALPSERLPITGSAGAALRRQQLQKQLPLHDIDHKACDGLSEEERREFDKYLNNLKQCAGQGKVSKLMTIRPFEPSLMTPANATDVQRFSPQHSQQLTKHQQQQQQSINGGLNLRTPSSFIPRLPAQQRQLDSQSISGELLRSASPSSLQASEGYARGTAHRPSLPGSSPLSKPVAAGVDVIRAQPPLTAAEANPRLGRYHHVLANVSGEAGLAEAAGVPGAYHPAVQHQQSAARDTRPTPCELVHSENASSVASEEYAQSAGSSLAQRIGESVAEESRPAVAHATKIGGQVERNLEFSSELPASSNARLAELMLSEALLPPSAVNAGDIVASSLDERGLMYIREKLSDKYAGKSDQQPAVMSSRDLENLSHQPTISASEDIKRSAEIAKEFEAKPNQQLQQQQPAPTTQSLLAGRTERLPIELGTSLPVHSSLIHSEALNMPVFPEAPVGGARIAQQNPDSVGQLQDELQAIKISTPRTRECHRCEEDIYPGAVVVTADKIKDAVWHPGCFKCCACNELLVDLVYFTYKGNLYCGRDLAQLLEIPRCHACDELIFVREYTVAEGQNYHVKHFCCWDCDTPLAGQLYVMENDRPLCLPCYQKYYAKTCNACNNAIAANQQGVAIKNLNFHATNECFCCVTCKKSLLGGQIAIKENRPLCSKECIAEFLHRRAMGR